MLAYIIKKIIFLIMCGAFLGNLCTTMSISEKKSKESQAIKNCEQLSVNILRRLHGPAFDARYMSITQPSDDDDSISDPLDTTGRKRNADSKRPSFYMTGDHTEVLSEEPAWNIEWESFETKITSQKRRKRSLLPIGEDPTKSVHQQLDTLNRSKRQIRARNEPWQCERKVKWINLGDDYHPSHLRSVECTQPKCYYNMYDCKPRHFAVRILQRRRGACADAASLKTYGFTGEYAEVWEWVEVAVNFCCDCVASKKYY
ncbi:protein trunk [Sitodiplosis mosellana]|uniref:protein trunk n=1 Tax=Sitodiplosis mosellana TaxID=263140 RepID=UPI0024448749|nr:protein trunk [Sitodiplosis mosellana]